MNKTDKLDDNILVKAENVCMTFKIPENRYTTLKERVIRLLKFKPMKSKSLNVLNDINFEIHRGESLGIIGKNGAGKSTLLRIVAGIYQPTSGKIRTNGKITLLNLGAGFDMEATAEENIYLSGAILGFTRKQMKERFNSIIEFSELNDFIKMPLKNYSSGMISRLGFAIAIDVEPDLMLIDEVLSVGDANFQSKCSEKIQNLKNKGVSFMLVSHNMQTILKHCQKALWIEDSKVVAYGDAKEVCDAYLKSCSNVKK